MHPSRLWFPLWFFSLSLFLILFILPLTRQGMFLDGVMYAAIAKNLSLGHGSLWQPFYSQTTFHVFYEHPPLAIYFQSLFFKLLGQGFGVEQLYCLLIAIGQFALISWYWLKKENTALIHLALLLLLWLLIPLNLKYVNNHLEGTLTLFTTLATLLLLIRTKSKSAFLAQYFLSSIAVIIAFFCNGPTAFFPLAVPLIKTMIEKPRSLIDGIKKTILLAFMISLMLSLVYVLVPAALSNTLHYLQQQLFPSVTGNRQLNLVGLNHVYIVNLYFRAYWLVSVFALGCMTLSAKIEGLGVRTVFLRNFKKNNVLLFILLSLVSSLPVGISHRQALNYIIQSAPFFTLAMMYLCFEPVTKIMNYCGSKPPLFKLIFNLNMILLATSFVTLFSLAHGFNSDQEIIEDINMIIPYCKNDAILSTSPAIYDDWHAGAYLARHSMMSLTPKPGNHYFLALKNEPLPPNYHIINLPLSYYHLASH